MTSLDVCGPCGVVLRCV